MTECQGRKSEKRERERKGEREKGRERERESVKEMRVDLLGSR